MKIARVFPTKTSMSPLDRDAYFGAPDLFTPDYDEAHISVTFSWDLERAYWLERQWESVCPVKMGGLAIDQKEGNGFVSGKYLKRGITITSRGCSFKCPWCLVDHPIREINIEEGSIIQDNNILACSKVHIEKVFQMLSHQTRIEFSGGLDSRFITDEIVEKLRFLKIYQLWLSYDHPDRRKSLIKAVKKLSKYFNRNQIRCYVLVGFNNDSLEKAEERLRDAWEIGTLPFAMRYRAPKTNWKDSFLFGQREWNLFVRKWTRPAIIKSKMKHGT